MQWRRHSHTFCHTQINLKSQRRTENKEKETKKTFEKIERQKKISVNFNLDAKSWMKAAKKWKAKKKNSTKRNFHQWKENECINFGCCEHWIVSYFLLFFSFYFFCHRSFFLCWATLLSLSLARCYADAALFIDFLSPLKNPVVLQLPNGITVHIHRPHDHKKKWKKKKVFLMAAKISFLFHLFFSFFVVFGPPKVNEQKNETEKRAIEFYGVKEKGKDWNRFENNVKIQ